MSYRKIALIYVRKSLVKKGAPMPASPERQEQACRQVAETLDLAPEIHVDAKGHLSGKNEDRPEWQVVRQRLRDPDVGALVVHTWNRAVRNTKILLDLVDELKDSGVRFIAVHNNIDTGNAAGRFQLTVMAGVDEYESNIASERRVEMIEHLRREKGRHYGLPPFGTLRTQQNGDLVLAHSERSQPNGTDFDALLRLYELYVTEGKSIRGVTVNLNSDGWQYRDRWGTPRSWNVDDVRRALASHWLYAGFVTIGRAYRDKVEIIRGSHPAILPDHLTQAVAARMATFEKWRGRGRRAPQLYPLSGVLACPCGERLRGVPVDNKRRYGHRFSCVQGHGYSFLADELEALVREHIATRAVPKHLKARSQDDIVRAMARDRSGGSAEMDRLRIQSSLERLKELYVGGDYTKGEYDTEKANLLAQMPAAEEDLVGGGAELIPLVNVPESIHTAPQATFRDMARALYDEIVVKDRETLDYHPQEWCQAWAK